MYGLSAVIEEDPSRFRPIDNPKIIGNYSKLEEAIGWNPEVAFEESVKSIFHYWYSHLR
jgi:GDP-4-dehydro-6-deoxy-D-mannose reductase